MLTRDSVIAQFVANGYQKITVTCPDGAKAVITPCACWPGNPKSERDIEYYLVACDVPYMDGDNLDRVIDRLNHHAEKLSELNDERARLRQFFDERIATGLADPDDLQWYSDWHKDCYGFRPHGRVCGVYVNPHV